MDCRSARKVLIDRLVEPSAGAADDDLAGHLETCGACRREAEALDEIWAQLGRLDVARPDDVRMRGIEAALSAAARSIQSPEGSAGQTDAHAPTVAPKPVLQLRGRRRATLVAALSGALAAGFVLGFASGQFRGAERSSAPAVQPTPRFLLLLHEPALAIALEPGESRARVAEYAAWARSLYADGRLVMAEKLGDEPGAWLPTAPHAADDVVSGFFLIVAENAADALNVARASPHLKYGGRIEIRRIEET